ncbi:MAG: cupin domain-containing protein [Flavisolibacter sp.]|jgi:oxalate decarboxylase/phosphoglucose isomerase-like protein (cupin superfamily)|nr:cupin domain-containing protein [Flavisolibacter sp.]
MKKIIAPLFTIICAIVLNQTALSQDVHKIAPTMYKVLSDTLGIKVMEATYLPGESSSMHLHPDFALYVISGGTVELTNTKGEKQVVPFTTGMGIVLPGESHTAKNIGETTLKLIVVEVRRPR